MRYNNFMTIMTAQDAVKTPEGALDRQASWVPLEQFKNIRCNIQEKNKNIYDESFSIVGEEHQLTMYHRNKTLYNYDPGNQNQTQLRIITALDQQQEVLFPIYDESQIRIYVFKGHIQQVQHHRRIKIYILRGEMNNRQVY
jgi:hypothetical protein